MKIIKEYYYWLGYVEGQDDLPYKKAYHAPLSSTIKIYKFDCELRNPYSPPEFIIECDEISNKFVTMASLRGNRIIKFSASIRHGEFMHNYNTIDIIDSDKNQEIYRHFCDLDGTYPE